MGHDRQSGQRGYWAKYDEELKFDECGLAQTMIGGQKIMIDMSGKEIAKAK